MGKTATRFTEKILVPPAQAIKYYGKAVAEIMDAKAKSSNRDLHLLNETEMKWQIGFVRGADSDTISDEAEYVQHLSGGTDVKLIGQSSSGKWWFEADISFVPPQVTAKLEAHARRICASRKPPDEEENEPKSHDEPTILGQYDQWLKDNYRHDKSVASLVRIGLEILIESVK